MKSFSSSDGADFSFQAGGGPRVAHLSHNSVFHTDQWPFLHLPPHTHKWTQQLLEPPTRAAITGLQTGLDNGRRRTKRRLEAEAT